MSRRSIYTQEFIDRAKAALIIHQLQRFAVIPPDHAINPKRCRLIMMRGEFEGVTPSPDAYSRHLDELLEEGLELPA